MVAVVLTNTFVRLATSNTVYKVKSENQQVHRSSDHAYYSYLLLHGRASSRHWGWQPISEVARGFGKQDTYIQTLRLVHFEYMLKEYICFIYHMCTKCAERIFRRCAVGEDFCNLFA